jgi:uncharacterized membrane protein (DUF4010 family)
VLLQVDPSTLASLDSRVVRILLAAALGLFLGLEREWSQKAAGIRTFSLVSLIAAVFVVVGQELLLVAGAVLVIAQGVLLAVESLLADDDEDGGLRLTTSMSMLAAYGIGALVASGYVLEGVTVAVLSSMLLVLKRELHSLAWGLSRQELRSTSEFAILAFVVFPLLPTEPVTVGPETIAVQVELRVVWLMVVTVAAIGIVNYVIVQNYGGRGIAITGFFGGLASSTAVVGTMLDHVRQRPETANYAVAAILLADAAMAVRNLAIAVGFTLYSPRPLLTGAAIPLGAVALGAVVIAAFIADWSEAIEMDLDSPFSMRNALAFGAVFLVIVVAGAVGSSRFGAAGLYVTGAISGLVSSAGVTASAVSLYRTGAIGGQTAVLTILVATASSVLVKAGLTAMSSERSFATKVATYSTGLLGVAIALTLAATAL